GRDDRQTHPHRRYSEALDAGVYSVLSGTMTAGSPILAFYRGGCDDRRRRLAEILAWSDARLEAVHDYIQWIFPLPEASGANPSAPVLSQADIAAFGADPGLRQ